MALKNGGRPETRVSASTKLGIQQTFIGLQHKDWRRRELDSILNDKMKRLDELGTLSTDYYDAVDRGFHKEKILTLQHEIKKLLDIAFKDDETKRIIAKKMYAYTKSL